MNIGVIVGGEATLGKQPVDEGSIRTADHVIIVEIFQHDDHDMLHLRNSAACAASTRTSTAAGAARTAAATGTATPS
jgi:hypothetical protein